MPYTGRSSVPEPFSEATQTVGGRRVRCAYFRDPDDAEAYAAAHPDALGVCEPTAGAIWRVDHPAQPDPSRG